MKKKSGAGAGKKFAGSPALGGGVNKCFVLMKHQQGNDSTQKAGSDGLKKSAKSLICALLLISIRDSNYPKKVFVRSGYFFSVPSRNSSQKVSSPPHATAQPPVPPKAVVAQAPAQHQTSPNFSDSAASSAGAQQAEPAVGPHRPGRIPPGGHSTGFW